MATLSFEEWKKEKDKLQSQMDMGGTLSFDEWKKARDMGMDPTQQVTTQPTVPPKPTGQPLFTKEDPKILLQSLMGFIPGGEEAKKVVAPPTSPKERIAALNTLTNPMAAVGVPLVKGLAGILPRMALSVSDLFGGPKEANIPILGRQTSYQQTGRELQQAGAGSLTSKGLPIIQGIFDILLGKGALSKGKVPVKEEVAPKTETVVPKPQGTVPKPAGFYGTEYLKKQANAPTVAIPKKQLMLPAPGATSGNPVLIPPPPVEGGVGKLKIKPITSKIKKLGQYALEDDEMFSPVVNVPPGELLGGQFFVDNKIVNQKITDIKSGKPITPIIVKDGQVVDGYHTAEALTKLGHKELPVTFVDTRGFPSDSLKYKSTPYKPVTGGLQPKAGMDVISKPPEIQPQYKTETPFKPPVEVVNNRSYTPKDYLKRLGEYEKTLNTPPVVAIPPEPAVPTNQELAQAYLKKTVNVTKPKETKIPMTNDAAQAILDKLVREPTERNVVQKKLDQLKKLNPYQFESGKVELMGPAGKEIVTRSRRVNASSIITAGDLRNQIRASGVDKLSLDEQLNWRAAMEGKAPPMSDRVAQLVNTWKPIFNKYGLETEVPMIENYFPRRLNETGRKFFENLRNKDKLVEEVMKEQGMDKLSAIKYVDKSLRRGSFEFERVLRDVPDQYRLDPIEELYQWATDVARRKGTIKEFGKKNEIIDNLLAQVGRGDKNEFKLKNQAQTYVNRVMGKEYGYSDLDPIYNVLKQGMVISKLNPLTTVANELQAHINSYLDYGPQGLADATFGKGGDKLITELGIKDMKGKYGEEVDPNSWATKWMKAIGMEGSETRGFARTAVSTKNAIERAFNQLRKDPTNIQAKKLLNNHAMYLDDATLARDLQMGKISEYEMKIGIVEGVRKKMFFSTQGERPSWANAGAGNVAYTFKNYILNQLQLLAKAPPERQLAYMMVIAPLTGLPIMMLRRGIQGKPLPDNLADWYVYSATAGPGTLFDIAQSLGINPVSFFAGGFTPALDMLTSKNKLKSATSNLPLSSWYLNRLFPPKNK